MNFEESYLGIIIDTYEREAMKSNDPNALKLMSIKSSEDMKALAGVAEKAMLRFPGSSSNFDEDPGSAASLESGSISINALTALGFGFEKHSAETFSGYLEKCFGCDGRINLKWQFLPPEGLLTGLESMFDGIKAALEALKNLAKPNKRKAAEICALIKLFDPIPCPQDLMILAMGLKMLLFKFTSAGLKLKLDWMSLFGPLIQAIVGALGYVVNIAFDAILGPLDCTLSSMTANLDLMRAFDPATFSKSLQDGIKAAESSDTTQGSNLLDKLGTINTSSYTLENKSNLQSSLIDYRLVTDRTENIPPTSISKGSDIVSVPGVNGSKSLKVPDGMSLDFSIADMMTSSGSRPMFADFSLPEQMIYSVDEVKRYLDALKKEILIVISSLNGLVHTGKLLEVQNLTAAIMVAELISTIATILKFNIKSCDDPKEHTKLEQLIAELTKATKVKIETGDDNQSIATITDIDGTIEKVTLHSCSYGTAPVPLDEIKRILADIERLTNE